MGGGPGTLDGTINQLKNELAVGRVDLPAAILVNIRDYDASRNLVSVGDQMFPSLTDEKLDIVDGQHRVEALKLRVG